MTAAAPSLYLNEPKERRSTVPERILYLFNFKSNMKACPCHIQWESTLYMKPACTKQTNHNDES